MFYISKFPVSYIIIERPASGAVSALKILLPRVAGVPPDYFSVDGQLWGNPLYNWNLMKKNGYQWWINRIKYTTELYDVVRIDHFRGFEAYWEIPSGEETAINGEGPKISEKEIEELISKLDKLQKV